MYVLVNGLSVGILAGWCRVWGGFARPVPRRSDRAVCSDSGGPGPGVDGAISTTSLHGCPVEQDVGG